MQKFFSIQSKCIHIADAAALNLSLLEYCRDLAEMHPDEFDLSEAEAMAEELARPFIPSANEIREKLNLVGGESKQYITDKVKKVFSLGDLLPDEQDLLNDQVEIIFESFLIELMSNPAYKLIGSSISETVIFSLGKTYSISYRDYSPAFLDWARSLPFVEESDDFQKTGKVNYHEWMHWSPNGGYVCLMDVQYVHKETGAKLWSSNNVQD